MSPAHIALIAVGVVSLTEALWGMTAPRRLQQAVREMLEDAPERSPGIGLFFIVLAGVLLLLITPDRRPSDWALVVISWLFVGGGLLNFKAGGFRYAVNLLILRREPMTLRLIYSVEFVLACSLITIGLFRW